MPARIYIGMDRSEIAKAFIEMGLDTLDGFPTTFVQGITKSWLFINTEKFTTKNEHFQKNNNSRRGGSNEYHNLCFEQK